MYPPNVIVSQPIYSIGKELLNVFYENDYVKKNSYDFENGIGKIFVTHDETTYPLEIDEEISFKGDGKKRFFKFNRPTLELQIELLTSKKYNLDLLTNEQKREHKRGIELLIDYTKHQIKTYDY